MLLLACLLVAASCGSGDDKDAKALPSRTATTEHANSTTGGDEKPDAAPSRAAATEHANTTALDPEQAERDAVIAAHEAAYQARRDSADPPEADPNDPAIAATHTGAMLEQWIDATEILQFNGTAIRYPENSQFRTEVESVRFDETDRQVAFLEVCTVEDSERIGLATGDVIRGGVRTVQATEAMQKVDGVLEVRRASREPRVGRGGRMRSPAVSVGHRRV